MKRERKIENILWLTTVFFLIYNCGINDNEAGSKTLEPVEEVVVLAGGENTTVTIKKIIFLLISILK